MSEPDADMLERRVLVLTPTAKDAAACKTILEVNGMPVFVCGNLEQLCREVRHGAGALLLPQEALVSDKAEAVRLLIGDQPPWSDLPIIVLTPSGRDDPRASRAIEPFRNVTLVKRPVELSVFVSTVRAALRDRQRQYELRAQLAVLTRQAEELRRSEEALREADRRKDEFLAMLAHELRNPLSAIGNAARLSGMTRDREQVSFTSEIIARQVGNLSRLVDDLLDVARVSQGKITLKRSPLELGKVVDAASELVQALVEKKRQVLRVEVSDPALRFHGDRTRVEQILGNILTNAAKYTEPEGHIDLSARRDGRDIVFVVDDDGIGIAEEMLPKVFGLFIQADSTIDRSQGGLGIGLTLVRSLVEMHGGTVTAASGGPGKGTTFTVRLPIGDVASEAPRRPKRPVARKKDRILVVDDNEDSTRLTARLLTLSGYEVKTAYDGHEAVELARSFRPEAVLLDIGLPGLDGYEVASILKADESCRDATFIALTGYGEESAVTRASEAGFHHHLTKPVDFSELSVLIESNPPSDAD